MKKATCLLLLTMFTGFVYAQSSANLSINISNIKLDGSTIYVGLYDNVSSFKSKSGAVDSVILIPDSNSIDVLLKNIPLGNYAVAVFQDINNNNRLDIREFKIPIEPIGISNYSATSSHLSPTFRKSQFCLKGDTLVIVSLISRE